jgi:hypothetical protein
MPNVVHIHNGVLFRYKEKINYVICMKMQGTGDYHFKWNKPDSKRKYCMSSLIFGNWTYKRKQTNKMSLNEDYLGQEGQGERQWDEGWRESTYKTDILLASRYLQRYSMSLVIREMQIKTTLRCILIYVRMAVIKRQMEL